MAKNGIRRSVSMRDCEYIALGLYVEQLTKDNPEEVYSRSSVLRMTSFGEIPPIPMKYLEMGKELAKIEREEREKSKANGTDKAPKKEPEEFRSGGGIFTF